MSSLVLVYLLPMTAFVGCYVLLKHRTSIQNRRGQDAAGAVSGQPGTDVTPAYRGESFSQVKPENQALVEKAAKGALSVPGLVLESRGKSIGLGNEAIIVCAGGIMPNRILEEIGIEFEVKYGTR